MIENNEEIENYAAQECEVLNTMEATTELCSECISVTLEICTSDNFI